MRMDDLQHESALQLPRRVETSSHYYGEGVTAHLARLDPLTFYINIHRYFERIIHHAAHREHCIHRGGGIRVRAQGSGLLPLKTD